MSIQGNPRVLEYIVRHLIGDMPKLADSVLRCEVNSYLLSFDDGRYILIDFGKGDITYSEVVSDVAWINLYYESHKVYAN